MEEVLCSAGSNEGGYENDFGLKVSVLEAYGNGHCIIRITVVIT